MRVALPLAVLVLSLTAAAHAEVVLSMPAAPSAARPSGAGSEAAVVDPGRLALRRYRRARTFPSITSSGFGPYGGYRFGGWSGYRYGCYGYPYGYGYYGWPYGCGVVRGTRFIGFIR